MELREGKKMTHAVEDWPEDCHGGIEAAIAEFKRRLPNWWYSLGECQVSCDATCAPTSRSADIDMIPLDERFNAGFQADLRQPSTLAESLRTVMNEALVAKSEPGRMHVTADLEGADGGTMEDVSLRLVDDLRLRHHVVIEDWRIVRATPFDRPDGKGPGEGHIVLSITVRDAELLLHDEAIVARYAVRQAEVEE